MQDTTLGITLMMVSTTTMSVGTVLQKRAVDALPAFRGRSWAQGVRAVLGAREWVAGWLLTVVALVLNWGALAVADMAVVQPLNGFGLVVLAVASRALLGETLGPRALAGMAVVVLGVAALGVTAGAGRAFPSVDAVLACFRGRAALGVLGGMCAMAGLLGAVARRWLAASGVAWALVAATCSVLGLTFSRGLFGIVALAGWSETLSLWPSYLLGVLLLGFSVLALAFQQLSFQAGRAVVVTPTFAGASVVLPLLTGRWVYEERTGPWTLAAVAAIAVGVVLLGARGGADAVPRE